MSTFAEPFNALIKKQKEALKAAQAVIDQTELAAKPCPAQKQDIRTRILPMLQGWSKELKATLRMQNRVLDRNLRRLENEKNHIKHQQGITWRDPHALWRRFKNLMITLLIIGIYTVRVLIVITVLALLLAFLALLAFLLINVVIFLRDQFTVFLQRFVDLLRR